MKKLPNKFFLTLIDADTPADMTFYQDMFDVGIQNAPVSMFIIEENVQSFVNRHFCELIGYSESEVRNGKIAFTDFVHPDDLSGVMDRFRKRMEGKKAEERYRVRFYRKNGELLIVEVHVKKTIRNGKAFLVGVLINVSAEVYATEQVKENQERFRSLFANNPDAVYVFDLEGRFLEANAASEGTTGYTAHELMQNSFLPLIPSAELPIATAKFQEAAAGKTVTYQIAIIRKDGQLRNLKVSHFPMKSQGEIVGVYGIAKDITDRTKHEKLLEELVFFDSLTKLPNRKLFEDRLKYIFDISALNRHQFTILYLGLDRFKYINDSFGHFIGDEFLKAVAERLQETLGELETVARFAADEFAILLPHADDEAVRYLAARINQVVSEPFNVRGHSLAVSCSLGIAYCSGGEENVEEVIKKAESAMYYTKKYGKNNYTVYTDELDRHTAYKLMIEKDLKKAVQNQEFVLHYQPITNLETGELSAVEALIRWNHPTLGLVPPDDFILISEESGQIVSVGKWVLHTACAQLKEWQEQGYPPFSMCVNISTIQLQHAGFIEMVKNTLEETGVEAKWLEFEVTESILMEDTKILEQSLTGLKKLGISISIDDFGTGYTSLSYLQHYSFDRVKIDRGFISDINDERKGKAITSTIILLAHQLNMSVIAEGIEDERQLAYLKELNCDAGQGYYFSRPISAEMLGLSFAEKKFC